MRALLLLPLLAAFATASPELEQVAHLYQSKDYTAAAALATPLAVVDRPERAEACHWLGRIAKRQGQIADAIRWMEAAVGHSPKNVNAWIDLGGAYGAMARKASLFEKLTWAKRCDQALTRAVTLAPESFEARAAIIDFCLEAPEMAGGGRKRALEEAKAYGTHDASGSVRLLVVIYERERRYEDALAACREELCRTPDDYALLYTFGRTAAIAGKAEPDALAALKRCLELNPPPNFPGHAGVWFRIGDLLKAKADTTGAREAYARAVELDPGLEAAKEALAKVSSSGT